jgi:uncharacterized protein YndB with AHSA1/START domain
MKILKVILIVLLILVAIPLLLAVFVERDYSVEREVTIERPVHEVFDYIKYLKNQNNYSKWAGMDPEMKTNFSGTDGKPGFISAWESDDPEVGKGEQEILSITENERVDYELRFQEPFSSTSQSWMTTSPIDDNSTRVTWGFSGHMPYPTNIFLLLLDMEEMLGEDFQIGLANLKAILEQQ